MAQGRALGAVNYTREQIKFIKDNWQSMSDRKMAKIVKIPVSSVQRCRTRMGLSRYKYTVTENSTIAYICELYVMGHKIKEICGIVGKNNESVSKYITKSLFGTPHTEETEVRTFQSKINQNDDRESNITGIKG